MMKKIRSILSIVLAFIATISFGQIDTPAASSAGSISATVGLTEITIDYSRPKMKGRKIFGEGSNFLVPFDAMWRTGANQGSKITLSTDANIGGTDVKAGEYLIYSVPGKDAWDVTLYSDTSLGGNVSGYDESKEVLKTSVTPTWTSTNTETLTFNISDISDDNTTANIELAWANASVKVPVKVFFHESVMKQISQSMVVKPDNYTAAANYYLNSGENLEQALGWMNTYLALEGNDGQFWHIHTKARILAAMGNKKEAITTAKISLEKAKVFERGDFGYIQRNEDLIKSVKKEK